MTEKSKPPLKTFPSPFPGALISRVAGRELRLFLPHFPGILKSKQLQFLGSNRATPVGEPQGAEQSRTVPVSAQLWQGSQGSHGQFGAFSSTLTLEGDIKLIPWTSYIS